MPSPPRVGDEIHLLLFENSLEQCFNRCVTSKLMSLREMPTPQHTNTTKKNKNTKIFTIPQLPSCQERCNVKSTWDSPSVLVGCLRCITWNTRGLIGSVFSKQKNREFKLKYIKKLFVNNNTSGSTWKRRVSPSYPGVGSAQEDRLSAFTGICNLKRLL